MKVYSQSTLFPVTISVDNPEKYTFAVFGRNRLDGIEAEPVLTLKNEDHVTYSPPTEICKYNEPDTVE